MNVFIRRVAIAASLVVSAAAQAATITAVPGTSLRVTDDARGLASTGRTAAIAISSATGSLYFSNGQADPTVLPATKPTSIGGLVGALNVGKVEVTAIDGATKDDGYGPMGSLILKPRSNVLSVKVAVTGLTADTATGAFSTVSIRGGATHTAYFIDGILGGGIATVNNLSIDLTNTANVKVSGNLVGTALINGAESAAGAEYGPQQSYNGVIWDQAKISGPTALPPAELIAAADGNIAPLQARGYTLLGTDSVVVEGQTMTRYTVQANNLITNLQVTDAAFAAFAGTLGLTEGGTGYNTLAGVNGTGGWGVMKAAITFQAYEVPAVPEPSTCAMMLLGLAGTGLLARRPAAG